MPFCLSNHISALALVLLVAPCAYAADQNEVQSACPEADTPHLAERLKGKVQFNAMEVQATVTEMKDQVKRLRKYSMILLTEAGRQNSSVARGPNVVGANVIPAAPTTTGRIALGPALPVRPGFVSALIADMSKEITDLHDRNNAIVEEISRKRNLEDEWVFVTSITRDMISHYNKIVTMLQNEKLSNKEVGREAMRIYEDTTAIQEPLNTVYSRLNNLSADRAGSSNK